MSAITLAVLTARRADAVRAPSAAADAYLDALRKAPRPVVVAHLVRAAGHLLALAVRVGVRGVRR